MNTMNTTKKADTKTFSEKLVEMQEMYKSIVSYLRSNEMDYGVYLKKYEGENWLFYCNEYGDGFVGKPTDYGWDTFEFHNKDELHQTYKDYEYFGWEPMTYCLMGNRIKEIKAVI